MANWNGVVASREEVRELKRRATLRVAATIFNEKGYHATSMDDVAEEVGVTKTALYYYFKNKEQLLYECLKLSYDCGQTARIEAEASDGTAFERLCFLYRRFMILLMEQRGAYTTMSTIRALPEEAQRELLDRRRQLDRYSRMLIERAIAEGDLRAVNVRVTSNLFLGAMNWILRWHNEDDGMSPEEIADQFLDLFLNGIVSAKHEGSDPDAELL
ncbi:MULTISPECIES: TetR/AcrR family transcriptional regulator [Roseobacteraceae]|uniref:HTH-type transcriptional repressor KstR2 n=1 Tax=Pseudosulfitobacter pseudonitzschiae TaxID=1402135 RepID=A0A221K7K3_9RHOB|nr:MULTISPECIES: TetR/AcrR family transcriptional regulator [Roseobacteraceae]ASM74992.1 HTH-type transcriptional repressor KstR2 [Pseudosulfitobacter pseudonitzschiae]